jgi:hypothetical protein
MVKLAFAFDPAIEYLRVGQFIIMNTNYSGGQEDEGLSDTKE